MSASGLIGGYHPNTHRVVAASTSLLTVVGAPPRNAGWVRITNANAAAQTAVLVGADGVSVTHTILPVDYIEMHGEFSATGAFSDALVTAVFGWLNDGSMIRNP